MPSPLIRRSLSALGGLLLLVAIVLVALPYLASTRIVRDRIAVEMSSWSGYRVEIGAPPDIDIWPRFRAVLTQVSFSEWGNTDGAPVATAERVEIMLSALAALRGDAVFTSVKVVRPQLRVTERADGLFLPPPPGGGRITSAIDTARSAVRARPESPDASALPSAKFGSIDVAEGTITVGHAGGDESVVTGVTGRIDWPALNKGGRMTGQASWRGEDIAFDLRSTNPLLMFAGGQTSIAAEVKAKAGAATFNGTAKLGEAPYFNGQASFTAPSFGGLAKWAGARIPAESEIGAASLSATISGNLNQLKFDKAELAVNGNRGTGAIELAFNAGIPRLSGSLAFETLDIGSLLAAFAPLTRPRDEGPARSGQDQSINIDLRFSAAQAKAGTIGLSDVAATAQIKNALAVFDISDATAFGGTVQAGLRFDRKPDGELVELRLLASDVDGEAFSAAAGMTRLIPVGRGTVSIILKGKGGDLQTMLESADGSVSANFGPGSLSGFDLAGFLQRTKDGGFFSLDEVSKGSLAIEGLDLEASVSKGVARIERCEARTDDRRIQILGIIPYLGRGLALTGTVGPAKGAAGDHEADFFVGGSWSAPFISPTWTNPPLE